jgi:metallo-beta-lactamase family protein
VKILGEKTIVRASVHSLGGFSAHAGQRDLLNWLAPMAKGKPKVFLTHGEERGREPLGACIRQRFGIKPSLPGYKDVIEL